MKKVLFSISLLWTFANADAMQQNQQMHASPFSNRDAIAVNSISTADANTSLGELTVFQNPSSNNPDYTYMVGDTLFIGKAVRVLDRNCVAKLANLKRTIATRIVKLEDLIEESCISRKSIFFSILSNRSVPKICLDKRDNFRMVIFAPDSNLEFIGPDTFAETNIETLSIPNSVKILDERCFKDCNNLYQVSFGLNSKLEYIGKHAFNSSNIESVRIPNSVRILDERCFYKCTNLKRVIFGSESTLELIGAGAFSWTNIKEVSIPDSVVELGWRCFWYCCNLKRITFGLESKLERIGIRALLCTDIESISIPDSVLELCDGCFSGCESLRQVTFGQGSKLERISNEAFSFSAIESVSIPDSVIELGAHCFAQCRKLRFVTFGQGSKLERISDMAFASSDIESLKIPDSVVELGERCFAECTSLRRVTFGTDLECIRNGAFYKTRIEEVSIPDSVRVLGDHCFAACYSLRRVTFGLGLECIMNDAFCKTGIEEVNIPDGVVELGVRCFDGTSLRSITFGIGSRLEYVGAEAFSTEEVTISAPDNILDIIQHSDLVRYNNLRQHISALTGMPIDSIHVSNDGYTWDLGDSNCVILVPANLSNMHDIFQWPAWIVFEEGSQLQSVDKFTCRLVKQIYLLGRPNWPQEVWDQLPVKPIKLYPDTTPDVDAASE